MASKSSRRSRSALSLVGDEWSSELPCLEADESSCSHSNADWDYSRRSSIDSSARSSLSSSDTTTTTKPRRAGRRTASDRATLLRQKLANAQDVKRTMNVYRQANQDVVMSDESARRDAEAVDESLKVMEGLMKAMQVTNQTSRSRRRESKVLLA